MSDRAMVDDDAYSTWTLTREDEDIIYRALRHCLDRDVFAAVEAVMAEDLLFVMDIAREHDA